MESHSNVASARATGSRSEDSSQGAPPFQQTLAYIDWVIDSDGKPVVRIFGSATTGQKSLMHLHGCYPYLYCDIPPNIPEEEFIYDIKFRIDGFLRGERRGSRSRVYRTSVVRDQTPIYGYSEARNVCKIELYDPMDVKRACDQLASDSFRVYNANVGYLLQVMVDHDLAGMEDITCSKYCFRGPLPTPSGDANPNIFKWTSALDLPQGCVWIASNLEETQFTQWYEGLPRPCRTSTCELELDVEVSDIISNKPQIQSGSLASKKIKFVKSLAVWWMAEEVRRKQEGTSTQLERKEAEEDEEHAEADINLLEDPYNFRQMVEIIAKRFVPESVTPAQASSRNSSTPREVRRTRTPYESGAVKPIFSSSATSSPYAEGPAGAFSQASTQMSQETLELMELLKSMKEFADQERGPLTKDSEMNDESTDELGRTASQMTDEELLSSTKKNPDERQRPSPSTLRPLKQVSFALDEIDESYPAHRPRDNSVSSQDGDDGFDEDDDFSDQQWHDILQSQRQYVESDPRADEDLDGGVFEPPEVYSSAEDDLNTDFAANEFLDASSIEEEVIEENTGPKISSPPLGTMQDDSKDAQFEEMLSSPESFSQVENDTPGSTAYMETVLNANANPQVLSGKSNQTPKRDFSIDQTRDLNFVEASQMPQPFISQDVPGHTVTSGNVIDFSRPVHRSRSSAASSYISIGDDSTAFGTQIGHQFEKHHFLTPPILSQSAKKTRIEHEPISTSEREKTRIFVPKANAPDPKLMPSRLNPIIGDVLHYADWRDEPKQTADEFHNVHMSKPQRLLETLKPVFSQDSASIRTYPSRPCLQEKTVWFEPVRQAPNPDGRRPSQPELNEQRRLGTEMPVASSLHKREDLAESRKPQALTSTGRSQDFSSVSSAVDVPIKTELDNSQTTSDSTDQTSAMKRELGTLGRTFSGVSINTPRENTDSPTSHGAVSTTMFTPVHGITTSRFATLGRPPKFRKEQLLGSASQSQDGDSVNSKPNRPLSENDETIREDKNREGSEANTSTKEFPQDASKVEIKYAEVRSVSSTPFLAHPQRQTSQISVIGSSLSHATPNNPVTGNQKKTSLRTALEKNPANNQLTLMGVEILARSRPTAAGREGKGKPFALLPDPDHDAVLAIFYIVRDDERDEYLGKGRGCGDYQGALYACKGSESGGGIPQDEGRIEEDGELANLKYEFECSRDAKSSRVVAFNSELEMFRGFVDLVREVDPDVLMGWEVQKDSLGYLLQRAKVLGLSNFARDLSRVPFGKQDRRHENDAYGDVEHSGFWLAGRHIFNMWRVCREELKLYQYTIHNVLHQLTGEKLPRFSVAVLCGWWDALSTRRLVCKHFQAKLKALLRISDHLDILGRHCELARLFGMDLFSVMTRGSQFRVEAVLLRVCRGLGYIMLSPTPDQVSAQPALEATPLIFEPESAFYSSPVLVLDFRSLYPSVIIANNICFSTCLGRLKQNAPDVSKDDDPFLPGLGCDPGYAPPLPYLTSEKDIGFVTQNGVCFVSKEKREGILPRMLREILDARVMIKRSVEGDTDEAKRRVADARQFGLKMIANVTYGYTAASFSGRMPCAEVADAIVQTGRACLELAIKIVRDKSAPWAPAECVYGDTDSLFVHLPGRSLEEARHIGKQISDAVSKALPSPMKLQFEKVFFPCVLEVKKRYVGWKYSATAPGKGEPDKASLDAKGIETIRRDGCQAVVKTMELVLKELFTSRDLSRVKVCLKRQFDKMFAGTLTLSDFVISGKVKLGNYSKDRKNKGNYPPAAVVADKKMKRDPRAKPVYKERVPYVVACGAPGSRLIDLVVDPYEFLNKNLRINVAHYVYKLVLPALDRLLAPCGVDVKSWFSFEKTRNLWGGWRRRLNSNSASETAINRFFEALPCVLCGKPSAPTTMALEGTCIDCGKDEQRARASVEFLLREGENRARSALNTCGRCVKSQGSVGCANPSKWSLTGAGDLCLNLDCEDFFERRRAMDRVTFDGEILSHVGNRKMQRMLEGSQVTVDIT